MIHDLTGKSWREVYSMAAFYMWPRYFGELVKVNISKTKSVIMKVISKKYIYFLSLKLILDELLPDTSEWARQGGSKNYYR